MNSVHLIGRITKDLELKSNDQGSKWCRFSIAIDRGKDKNGNDLGTDFPTIVCFGKTAESIVKHMAKGRLIGIEGRIRTGKYQDKNDKTVYTTEIYADHLNYIDWGDSKKKDDDGDFENVKKGSADNEPEYPSPVPQGFQKMSDDDIPF